MSHFAGYLKTRPQDDDASSERALLGRMARTSHAPTQQLRSGRLWVAAVSVPVFRDAVVTAFGPGLVAMAGDPLPEPSAPQDLLAGLAACRWQSLECTLGSFAALGWDGERLLLATDKVGSRPLYWKREAGRLLFATSLRWLRSLQGEAERVDEQGLAETLFLGQPLANRTALAGVQVLRPGHALLVEASGEAREQRYFDLAAVTPRSMPQDEAVPALHGAFSRAVQRRLRAGEQQAFLSGGLDSRAVVAELIDQGQTVRSFCAAYPGSLDDLAGQQIAAHLGTRHHTWHRSPADRVRVALDPFALYARDHFPDPEGRRARAIWSGDGGSVTLGHVYMNEATVERAAGAIDGGVVRDLFPGLNGRPTRQIARQKLERWADLANDGALQAFGELAHAPPERRLFLFYMLNDQARHLYHHFERIEESGVELLTPFFDAEFVTLVQSLPIAWFLRHRLYNDWIQGFRCQAGSLYWQPYRNHIPGPHANPWPSADQWSSQWYSGADVRRSYREIAADVLRRRDPLVAPLINRPLLHLVRLRHALGLGGQEYEVSYARNLVGLLGE